MLEDTKQRLRETAKEETARQTATAKRELGRTVLDAANEYFPEEARERRRRDLARGFLAGLVGGVLLRYAIGRR